MSKEKIGFQFLGWFLNHAYKSDPLCRGLVDFCFRTYLCIWYLPHDWFGGISISYRQRLVSLWCTLEAFFSSFFISCSGNILSSFQFYFSLIFLIKRLNFMFCSVQVILCIWLEQNVLVVTSSKLKCLLLNAFELD